MPQSSKCNIKTSLCYNEQVLKLGRLDIKVDRGSWFIIVATFIGLQYIFLLNLIRIRSSDIVLNLDIQVPKGYQNYIKVDSSEKCLECLVSRNC